MPRKTERPRETPTQRELAEIYRKAREDALCLGQMRFWLEQAARHPSTRARKGRDMALANATGWASR